MKKQLVSIIIRTKNEERWISACLKSIISQTYKNYEIIIVDNESRDQTLKKAKQFKIKKICIIKNFLPGKALNLGIKNSKGKYIVCLSAHCIPTNNSWLENLVDAIQENKKYAGVYGRQEPMSFSSSSDKRDLHIVFGLDRKIQKIDSFFHNANSIIRRDLWNKYKFDNKTTNIEDRLWAQKLLNKDFQILYEPKASVYHFHGIHQDGNKKRLSNIVKIIESKSIHYNSGKVDAKNMNIIAIIPIRGKSKNIGNKKLLDYTINAAKKSKLIKKIIVSTDDLSTAKIATKRGALCPFIRPAKFSKKTINHDIVQNYSLKKIEEKGIYPDLIVHLEETFPFRSKSMIDEMILHLLNDGYDTVMAARREAGLLWHEDVNDGFKRIDFGDMPRDFKEKTLVGLRGLCTITYPEFIRNGKIEGKKIGLYEINNHVSSIEVRDKKSTLNAAKIINKFNS